MYFERKRERKIQFKIVETIFSRLKPGSARAQRCGLLYLNSTTSHNSKLAYYIAHILQNIKPLNRVTV